MRHGLRDRLQGSIQQLGASTRQVRTLGDGPAPRAPAWNASEQVKQVASDRRDASTCRHVVVEVGAHGCHNCSTRGRGCRDPEHQWVDPGQHHGVLVSCSAYHDAVDLVKMAQRLLYGRHATVELYSEPGALALESVDVVIP